MSVMEERFTVFESGNVLSINRTSGTRTNEVVIGDFKMKSKHGAMTMVQAILGGVDGSPSIIIERVANVPEVIPVMFDTAESASRFVEAFKQSKEFIGYFDGF